MLIDLLIVAGLIGACYRSRNSGFIRQAFATVGFFVGLYIGRQVETYTVSLAHTHLTRAVVTIVTILSFALGFLTIGEYFGIKLKYGRLNKGFDKLDNYLGVILTGVTFLLAIWLLASTTNGLPPSNFKTDVENSKIITALNNILPAAPSVVADIGQIIAPNGFPDVFIGSDPIPKGNINLPSLGSLQSAVAKDESSVVRIQGQGCGGIVSGSGFVIGNGLVATNAHVVAGIVQPEVEDSDGTHESKVVWFDPNLDFAILQTSGLAGKPLTLSSSSVTSGSPAAVLGYPGGGNFNAAAAAIIDSVDAGGRNIYGSGITLRSIYELKATVIPGNSGGPLVAEDGSVIGVVFAKSTSEQDVGYALTMGKVVSEINQAESNKLAPVSSGKCAE